jgi:ribosome-associated heat shock protein Hsp15
MARVDKFIWSVRLFKTRSLATVKPSRDVKIGDTIALKKNGAIFTYKVLALLDNRVGAKLVADYVLDTTPIEEVEKFKLYQASQANYRDNGMGKPTTKERRTLEKFIRGSDFD